MITWQWVGYNAIIYLAGLQAIPADVYEAAKVDGAGPLQMFCRITVPLLRPVSCSPRSSRPSAACRSSPSRRCCSAATPPTNSGGPGQAGLTIVLYFYQQAFSYNHFGYGAAIAWAIFVIVVLFTIINWRLVARQED